jgi:hypothetical protein
MKFKNIFLGKYPISSLIGYLIAGLTSFQMYFKPGVEPYEWVIPVTIAILGRMSTDFANINNKNGQSN